MNGCLNIKIKIQTSIVTANRAVDRTVNMAVW